MTDDIKLAFSHPLERSNAIAATGVRDRISLRDHIREVDIGAFQAERGLTQRVRFDVVVEVGLPELDEAVRSDDVDKILSYDAITEAIDRGLASERLNLLETLAAKIADDILTSPLAVRVFIRIEKLDRGSGELGVEIVRDRNTAHEMDIVNGVRPFVVFLENDAVMHDGLPAILDKLEQSDLPLILCVGKISENLDVSSVLVRRRIDLLSIEQNAWRLAGRDARCAVVSTRTELDWAMKNSQICVWAPSKIVLDATDLDAKRSINPLELADWFAQEFNAIRQLSLGTRDESFAGLIKIDNIPVTIFLGSN